MAPFVSVDHVDKVFNLPNGGQYIALKNIELDIKEGEFVSLIGHSGCGKSTLLNIIAGLDRASAGGVVLEGQQVTKPGPDRMVVFQNYSLLPWKTVRQNIALGVDTVLSHLPKGERRSIIESMIDMVGLRPHADKFPNEISGGQKQRVSIARALSLRPKVLLLDEPFGALDALTRGNLQEQLMRICQESNVTAVMVTHDVDEALLLSDRIVMLTNGPDAHIGQILEVDIPRPRQRLEVVNHPSYYNLRNEIIYFLNQQKRAKRRKAAAPSAAVLTVAGVVEKRQVDLGFLPLTDCAPLVVAKEKGFFAKHGIETVNLVREFNWSSLAEGVAASRLDGAPMLAGMPLAMSLGMEHRPAVPIVRPMVLSRNGDAVTISNALHDRGISSLKDLRVHIKSNPDRPLTFGVVDTASMENLLLRYWLASAGIDPDREVKLVVIPPPQMVTNLQNGTIDGYCVGAPYNSMAVRQGIGHVLVTDLEIWSGHPEKVFGLREDWVERHPKTTQALLMALIEACEYCDDRRHRSEIVELLSLPQYLGPMAIDCRPGFSEAYNYGPDREPAFLNRYPQFYTDQANYPRPGEGLWMMGQFARWGMAPFPKNWLEVIDRIYRVDLFNAAVRQLGLPALEPSRKPFALFDGQLFDPNHPLDYVQNAAIGQPITVEEIPLSATVSTNAPSEAA
jgi:nitrate/nitrite transport system ATP-binding protein